ncbi:MAG: anhydro-N-acetylmuramic acid kinase [Rhodothermales bacterium]|jgi:anhydro-N-acetylmuramic acid kinase
MSGTSLDGIDVALVRLEGSGTAIQIEVLGTLEMPFSPPLAALLRECAEAQVFSVDAFCLLGPRLAGEYGRAIRSALAEASLPDSALDLVGCHGQTVRHQPDPVRFAGESARGTLQLGSGPALAAGLGCPVVYDFRSADMALGGQGAPLVPYLDYVLLSSPEEHRVALNLGGIANVTALRAGAGPEQVMAFDTGPANMLIDAICQRLLGLPFDEGGRIAASGSVIEPVLVEALRNPYFDRHPPKSAGRQSSGDAGFGAGYADRFLARCEGHAPADVVATASMVTIRSVADSVDRFVPFRPDVVIVSGGGARNAHLLGGLSNHFGRVRLSDEFGVDSAFKEAIAFAVLAHEAVNGVPTGMPAATGASRPAVLGAITRP